MRKILTLIFMMALPSCKTLYWSNMNNTNAPIDQSKTYNNSTVIDNSRSGPSYTDMRMNSIMDDYYESIDRHRAPTNFEYNVQPIDVPSFDISY